jgi:plasmid stabilization system protein ParE
VAVSVVPTPLAARQIREEARWWRRNRTKAPALFRGELRRALKLIGEYPEAGAFAEDTELPDVRRVLLAATQHYLYYRWDVAAERIDVLALWSTHRGAPPPIR